MPPDLLRVPQLDHFRLHELMLLKKEKVTSESIENYLLSYKFIADSGQLSSLVLALLAGFIEGWHGVRSARLLVAKQVTPSPEPLPPSRAGLGRTSCKLKRYWIIGISNYQLHLHGAQVEPPILQTKDSSVPQKLSFSFMALISAQSVPSSLLGLFASHSNPEVGMAEPSKFFQDLPATLNQKSWKMWCNVKRQRHTRKTCRAISWWRRGHCTWSGWTHQQWGRRPGGHLRSWRTQPQHPTNSSLPP